MPASFCRDGWPRLHTAERSRDMIGGVVGLLTLLLALVLGLLIWTAYGVYNTQQTELQTIAARALEFDLEMRQYGPEGDPGRELLRRDLVWAHEQFWGDENRGPGPTMRPTRRWAI